MGPTHGHRHRHGHFCRLPREDRREDVGMSVQLAKSRTHTTILSDLSADLSDTRTFPCEHPHEDVRACTRVNVYCKR